MDRESLYIIDANIFIQAARTYYSFQIAPGFWGKLVEYAEQNKIISIDKVFQEIKDGNEDDPLRNWAITEFSYYFDTTRTNEIIEFYGELVKWAHSQSKYLPKAKDEFMDVDNADAWVIAYAKINNCTVVTSELKRMERRNSIPIPVVCEAFDIPYCDTFEMLAWLNFTF